MLEILIDSVVGGGEDVEPFEDKTLIVEDEAAEEAVFGIGDERENLTWSAGEQSREARTGKLDKLTVFAAGIRYHFVMESLAEAIGEVAIVGLEGVGEGVALGFEDDADALVVVEHLIDSGGGAVGRDEKGADWRFGRLLV